MTDYQRRLQRMLNAVHMKPVDKIPVSYNGPAYLAKEMGLTIGEYVSDFKKATDAAVAFLRKHPGIDSIHSPIIDPRCLSLLWLSPVLMPGIDLPEDELWQVIEKETMTEDDYEIILKEGFGPWSAQIMKDRLGDPLSKMEPFFRYEKVCYQRIHEAGYPVMNPVSSATPFEHLCGGRTLMNFFVDLVDDPEYILEVSEKIMEHDLASLKQTLTENQPISLWIGGWRSAPELLSHDTWMEFVWPNLKKAITTTVDMGAIPILHFDSCWNRELEILKELPPRKCILMLDGSTDIHLAREILDDRMCIMGDVPAQMLAFGTEDDVYRYATGLIRDIGPKTGYIVSSGCDVPLNARPENVAAMIQAACDYAV